MIDTFIIGFDQALRTVFSDARSRRPIPGASLPDAALSSAEKRKVAGLMRVNHVGEICAQALYQGQALTSRDPAVTAALREAAEEETEHLAWTAHRLAELGARKSLLNPVWYGASLALGVAVGKLGDRWNLGFLAETERQVEAHLASHLTRLPEQDERSRAIVAQMKCDEAGHAATAQALGGARLPAPARVAMRWASRVMTGAAYWV